MTVSDSRSHPVRAPRDRFQTRRRWIRLLLVAVAALAAGYSYVLWWKGNTLPRILCEQHLRMIYVATRKLPLAERQGKCPATSVGRMLDRELMLAGDDMRYINPNFKNVRNAPMEVSYQPGLGTMLCPLDPEYSWKYTAANAHTLEFAPSYTLCPDSHTLAYCPYHRYALLVDGRIEHR